MKLDNATVLITDASLRQQSETKVIGVFLQVRD